MPDKVELRLIGGGGGSRLPPAGGSGGGGGLPPEQITAYIQAEMRGVKAELSGAIDTRLGEFERRLERLPGWNGHLAVIGAIFTAVGLIIAVLAFGGDRFDGGVAAGGLMAEQTAVLNAKLDQILQQQTPPPER